ncbi:hypothetical protein [Colwellia psychrerythraea]|uniref:Uncharacterized protein n=1 Tax=Colwellia psychrerythraea TaxID=28229 RepID=A0A099L047_COLPS|nr:hypothetical protein [Colwellia psychrerythraea]KGJ95487.1 hypothetical protein ND2E_1269 [Colwellia psychrerythraea]
MKPQVGVIFLVLAALIAMGTAAAHLSCIYLGPECYAAQMAPPLIVESAINGTYLAPIGTIFASGIFVVLGLYALSAAGFTGILLDKLPLVNYAIYTIATLCIIRGVLPLQLWLRHPEKISESILYVGIVWLITGLLYLVGYRICSTKPTSILSV